MTWTPETITALILALGGGATFREIVSGLHKLLTGQQTRERDSNQLLIKDNKELQLTVDAEAARRRRVEEHASELRRIIIENGLKDQLPEYPK